MWCHVWKGKFRYLFCDSPLTTKLDHYFLYKTPYGVDEASPCDFSTFRFPEYFYIPLIGFDLALGTRSPRSYFLSPIVFRRKTDGILKYQYCHAIKLQARGGKPDKIYMGDATMALELPFKLPGRCGTKLKVVGTFHSTCYHEGLFFLLIKLEVIAEQYCCVQFRFMCDKHESKWFYV